MTPEEIDVYKYVTINADPDNPRNLLLACAYCPDIVIPVRSGISLPRTLKLINIHLERDHPRHSGSEPTAPVTSR